MSKPFKTLDEQIELMHSRNLTFSNKESAKRFLLYNNYYNVINYYSKFFMDRDDHYITGTSFDEITHVYYFDKEIKSIFFKAILEIEKQFKSVISYIFSEVHVENYSYLNANNFRNDDILEVTQTIAYLSKIISKKKNEKKLNSIKHYINQHHNVPLWVLSNYMTFGQTITFYQHMKSSEQNKVAKIFANTLANNLGIKKIMLTPMHILSFLKNLCEVRNIVAHGNKFLGYRCKKNIVYVDELYSIYGILPESPRQDIFSVFIIIKVFMSGNQFAIISNSLRKRIKELSKSLNVIDINLITQSLGFPHDWHSLSSLNQ